ncbi:MAG: DUF1015 domain-containing protein [Armatimonadota bacterium]
MAEVRGFPGIRFQLERPEQAGEVIAPPYDVISPAQHEALLEQHPHNVVRLELPKSSEGDTEQENRYTRAARLFREWREQGVLAQDPEPSLYVYGQRYDTPEGPRERLGLMVALKVEPFESGVVLPHEQTFPKHKEDRYRLLSTAQAQFSPIFGLYSAPEAGVRARLEERISGEPVAIATDPEGVEHRLWRVAAPEFTQWAAEVFAGKQVYIADGHHRYETALRYRNERRAAAPESEPQPFDYVMTFLVEMEDPGLVLLPTHRLVRGSLPDAAALRQSLEEYFTIEPATVENVDDLRHHQLGLLLPGGEALRLTLKDPAVMARLDQEHSDAWRDLDVAVLHRLVFQEVLNLGEGTEVVYTRDPAEAREAVVSGGFAASFLLPYPKVEELKAVAGAGDRMPEKSTYFWPKAITGLVIYPQ